MRTFIAVELPDKFIHDIEKICSMLKVPGVKPVRPDMVHITMKFLGDVREDEIEAIASALSQIDCKAFEARIKGMGVFPKPSFIRVIWLGAHGPFDILHSEVERVLTPFRFEKDTKFSPHATLARVKESGKKREILERIKNVGDIDLGIMNVESISLKKSTLMPEGPVYNTLHELKLRKD
ncbi:MAG: RNA 2',3'-cyclic phosphodiesterase [Candidatus Methanoperedens sp.]|nr:RNA 2',3'-cyclic phosphodiesterase [Candidatus Methanoperedens sp.]MCE8426330.1 RNA 2',3'-cyclic phosphodiesterase [Candidatus Methanoperedens sp.]MCE8428847.1 RNA 2',3'-cyclic phosphodiesterase [Candidatus Methanoperedens sp.]